MLIHLSLLACPSCDLFEDADAGGPAMFGAVPLLQIPGTAAQAAVSPGQLSSGSNPEADLPPELHAVLEPAVASAAVMSSQVNLVCS